MFFKVFTADFKTKLWLISLHFCVMLYVQPMLEHVRIHPELVTGTKDHELDPTRSVSLGPAYVGIFPIFLLSHCGLLFLVDGKSMKYMTLSLSVLKCLWTRKRPPAKQATPPCLRPSTRRSTCDHKTVLRAPSVTFTAASVSLAATCADLELLWLPSANVTKTKKSKILSLFGEYFPAESTHRWQKRNLNCSCVEKGDIRALAYFPCSIKYNNITILVH